MKTWEAIEVISKRNDAIFQTEGVSGGKVRIFIGQPHCRSAERCILINSVELGQEPLKLNATTLAYEWEEVKQPVTWQEAIAHHIECAMSRKQTENKNSFKVEMGSVVYFQSKMLKLGCFSVVHENIQSKSNGIDAKMLENGKWYILD